MSQSFCKQSSISGPHCNYIQWQIDSWKCPFKIAFKMYWYDTGWQQCIFNQMYLCILCSGICLCLLFGPCYACACVGNSFFRAVNFQKIIDLLNRSQWETIPFRMYSNLVFKRCMYLKQQQLLSLSKTEAPTCMPFHGYYSYQSEAWLGTISGVLGWYWMCQRYLIWIDAVHAWPTLQWLLQHICYKNCAVRFLIRAIV